MQNRESRYNYHKNEEKEDSNAHTLAESDDNSEGKVDFADEDAHGDLLSLTEDSLANAMDHHSSAPSSPNLVPQFNGAASFIPNPSGRSKNTSSHTSPSPNDSQASLFSSGIQDGDSSTASSTDHVYVDASDAGIGFFFANQWEAWRLKPGWKVLKIRDIQWAEAAAVDLGVRLMIEAGYAGKEIILHSDNQQVVNAVCQVHRIGPQNGLAAEVVRNVIELCQELDIQLKVGWINGPSNPADHASRLEVGLKEEARVPYRVEIPSYLQEFVVAYEM
ncbi:hypothetical protein D9756_009141 [Leucocoprinus leucothites]|uniref:RNase H type-1 domain-containing protein n=1 Tax=Leucocoprinus leucothites TaxID=201217 RepID=A0A8H5CY96_9AGAR|nr:hypothetical protein D9756_009141 [Leucoagaricus leucothites]